MREPSELLELHVGAFSAATASVWQRSFPASKNFYSFMIILRERDIIEESHSGWAWHSYIKCIRRCVTKLIAGNPHILAFSTSVEAQFDLIMQFKFGLLKPFPAAIPKKGKLSEESSHSFFFFFAPSLCKIWCTGRVECWAQVSMTLWMLFMLIAVVSTRKD